MQLGLALCSARPSLIDGNLATRARVHRHRGRLALGSSTAILLGALGIARTASSATTSTIPWDGSAIGRRELLRAEPARRVANATAECSSLWPCLMSSYRGRRCIAVVALRSEPRVGSNRSRRRSQWPPRSRARTAGQLVHMSVFVCRSEVATRAWFRLRRPPARRLPGACKSTSGQST